MSKLFSWFIMNLFVAVTLIVGLYQEIDILLAISLMLIWWCGLNAFILLSAVLVGAYTPNGIPPVNKYIDFSYDIFIIFMLSSHGYLVSAFMQVAVLLYCQIAFTYHENSISCK